MPSAGGLLVQILVVGGAIGAITYFVADNPQSVPDWVPYFGHPVADSVMPAGPAVPTAAAAPGGAPAAPAAAPAVAPAAAHPAPAGAPPAAAPKPAPPSTGAAPATRPPSTPTPTPTPPPPPPPPSISFSDGFEADAAGAPPAGWKASGQLVVAVDGSHVLRAPGTRWGIGVVGASTWGNYRVAGTLKSPAVGHSRLVARYASPGNYYYCGLDRGTTFRMGRVQGGSAHTLQSATYTYSGDRAYNVAFRLSGSTLTCTVTDPSGALRPITLSAADPTFATGEAGWMGFAGGEVDNYSASAA